MARWPTRTALASGLAVMAAAAPVEGRAQARSTGDREVRPAAAAGRSLILPGWGQKVLGQRRAWAYAAAEVVLWALWANRRSLATDARDAYRDLAWSEARLDPGERHDGDWDYYEKLSHWQRSGAFDRDPAAPGVQPEEDPSTFNGSVWALARDLYFQGDMPPPDAPTYRRAVEYYERAAYGPAFLWDWSGREAALTRYRALIDESDDRFRQATTAIGVVVANHLLAAGDAYLSSLPGEPRLRVTPGGVRGSWRLGFRVAAPR